MNVLKDHTQNNIKGRGWHRWQKLSIKQVEQPRREDSIFMFVTITVLFTGSPPTEPRARARARARAHASGLMLQLSQWLKWSYCVSGYCRKPKRPFVNLKCCFFKEFAIEVHTLLLYSIWLPWKPRIAFLESSEIVWMCSEWMNGRPAPAPASRAARWRNGHDQHFYWHRKRLLITGHNAGHYTGQSSAGWQLWSLTSSLLLISSNDVPEG